MATLDYIENNHLHVLQIQHKDSSRFQTNKTEGQQFSDTFSSQSDTSPYKLSEYSLQCDQIWQTLGQHFKSFWRFLE